MCTVVSLCPKLDCEGLCRMRWMAGSEFRSLAIYCGVSVRTRQAGIRLKAFIQVPGRHRVFTCRYGMVAGNRVQQNGISVMSL